MGPLSACACIPSQGPTCADAVRASCKNTYGQRTSSPRQIVTSSQVGFIHHHYPPVLNMSHRAGTRILHLSLFAVVCSAAFM